MNLNEIRIEGATVLIKNLKKKLKNLKKTNRPHEAYVT